MSDRRARMLLVVAAVVAAGALLRPTDRPVTLGHDAGFTYGYLPSVVAHGDLDSSDDALPFDSSMPHTATGRAHNAFPIGAAVWWTPGFLVGHALAWGLRSVGVEVATDGRSWPYDLTVVPVALLVGVVGLLACYDAARRYVDVAAALVGVVAVWLAGPAINVTHERILTSNATGFAAAAVWLATWLRWRARPDASLGRLWAFGLLGGLVVATRWQHLVLLAGPAWDVVSGRLRGRRGDAVGSAAFLGGAVLGVLPQLLVWQVLYGSPLRPPRGESAGVFLDLGRLHLWEVLFSWRHGMLAWHPVLAVGIVGLVWWWRRDRTVAAWTVVALVLTWVVNAGVLDWWAGASFGARRFDGLWPALAVGVALAADRVGVRRLAPLVAAAAAFNWWWHLAYLDERVSRIEAVTPLDVVAAATPPWGHLGGWSALKAVWVVALAVLGSALVSRRWQPPSSRRLAAAGSVAALVVGGAVGVAGLRTPAPYDPHTFEAGYFVPAWQRPATTGRWVTPDEAPWTLAWIMPGFLPEGRYRVVAVDVAAAAPPATLEVWVADAPALRADVDGRRDRVDGAAVTLRRGFHRIELRAEGGPVWVGAVRLEPAGTAAAVSRRGAAVGAAPPPAPAG